MTTPAYLTVTETAELCRVDPRTVKAWISRGILPSVRIGGRRLIKRSDIEDALETSACGPTDD